MTKLILVGGFLGSGKTTLLAEATKRLAAEGKAVGLITNDQAPELVDTRLLTRVGKGVAEVSGSCFCCNFNGFIEAVKSLIAQRADTIIGEPVGSCTDLSATIINPIKKFHPDWNIAPLTVLVDPSRLLEVLGETVSHVDPDALYIMKLQLQEADWVLVSKSDLLSAAENAKIQQLLSAAFPDKPIGLISAKTGNGVATWLTKIQAAPPPDAGTTIVSVDYDRYAHGEAVLGWLNATASVAKKKDAVDINAVLQSLMTAFQAKLKQIGAEVGHVKAILHLDGKESAANLTRLDGEIDVRNVEPKSDVSTLIFNARVQTSPDELEALVRELLVASDQLDIRIQSLRCLMPGYPTPTHRFVDVV